MIFLFLYHLKIGGILLVNGFAQSGIFGKVVFIIIFTVYFNILKSKVLVHLIDPTARFGHCVSCIKKSSFGTIFNVIVDRRSLVMF